MLALLHSQTSGNSRMPSSGVFAHIYTINWMKRKFIRFLNVSVCTHVNMHRWHRFHQVWLRPKTICSGILYFLLLVMENVPTNFVAPLCESSGSTSVSQPIVSQSHTCGGPFDVRVSCYIIAAVVIACHCSDSLPMTVCVVLTSRSCSELK